jgi:hypothetical protein
MNNSRCGRHVQACEVLADGRHGTVHASGIHIQVRDKAQAVQAGGLHAAAGQVRQQAGGFFTRRRR